MKKLVTVFFLFLFLLYSCEYSKDPVYMDEVKPSDNYFSVEINLADIDPYDTIYVYDYTRVSFTIATKGNELFEQKITINANSYIEGNGIQLYPLADNSVRELVLDLEIKKKIGSIAQKLDLEKIVGRYIYYVKFVKLEEYFDIKLRQSTSNEGYLQLEWDAPRFDNATLLKYEIAFENSVTRKNEIYTITDPKQTHFIDKSYVWGYRNYKLSVYYQNKDVNEVVSSDFYIAPQYYNSIEALFSYDYIDQEWMDVSWKYTGYKCKYLLVEANGEQVECTDKERKARIQRFRFPSDSGRFRLYVLPYDVPYEEYKECPSIDVGYVLSDKDYLTLYPPLGWDIERDESYFLNYGYLDAYSIANFRMNRQIYLSPLRGEYEHTFISASSRTSQVAISAFGFWSTPIGGIYIYPSDNFEDPIVLKTVSKWIIEIQLRNNWRLFYKDDVLNKDGVVVYSAIHVADSKTGEIVSKIRTIQQSARITVSSDGNYVCEYYKDGYYVYRLENDSLSLIYSHQNSLYKYMSCQFSHINPDELILSGGNETIIFDVSTLTEKKKVKGAFLVQDPKTGNYACLDEYFNENSLLNIYDDKFNEVLIKVPFTYFEEDFFYKPPYFLLNNRLIFAAYGRNVGLDLTEYITNHVEK